MTEYQKMLSGQWYDSADQELLQLRSHARRLVREFNNTPEHNGAKRTALLKQLFGSVKDNIGIEGQLAVDYGTNTHIGSNFFANFRLTLLDCAKITIGDNCMFGPNVSIVTPIHPLDAQDRKVWIADDGTMHNYEKALPVTIGNNVWLATGVIVNGGVTIGDNVVIGSGSVVTRDIPPNVIAMGNPCRVLRAITDQDKATFNK